MKGVHCQDVFGHSFFPNVIGVSVSEPPSSEFNGDFCLLLRRRSRLGTSCAWVRTVCGYVRVMPASCTKRCRQLCSAVDNNSVREALRRGRMEADRSRRAPRTAQVQGGVVFSFPSMIRLSTRHLVHLHTPRSRSPPQWSTFT